MKNNPDFDFLRNDGKEFPLFSEKGNQLNSFSESMKSTRRHILLSGELFYKHLIYKYVDRRNFFDYIGDNHFSLCFRQISEWKDPYEKRFYEADYSCLTDIQFDIEQHRRLYACCFASQSESEPSWKMYVDDNNKKGRMVCVQVQYDFKALLTYLNHYIETKLNGDYMLIVCPVKYLPKFKINEAHRPGAKGNLKKEFFGAPGEFDFSKYLQLLSLKREAFKYEDEIRFFLVPKKTENMGKSIVIPVENECKGGVPVSRRWKKIVSKVYLDPCSTAEEVKAFKAELKKKNFELDDEGVDTSHLMNDINRIVIGESYEKEKERMGLLG